MSITETEIRFILEKLVEVLNSNDPIIAYPEMEEITDFNKNTTLDSYNVNSCLDTIKEGKIPVLIGLAGAGKTYTVENMCGHIMESCRNRGLVFDKMYKVFIPCLNVSQNDFWGGYDAVLHTCIGKFQYIWREAEKNPNTLYYVILDEFLDIDNVRETFGDSFSRLTSLPENMIVVGTGYEAFEGHNNYRNFNNMLSDTEILDRFNFITIRNILEDKEALQGYIDMLNVTTDVGEYAIKIINRLVNMDLGVGENKKCVLIPRKVTEFIEAAEKDALYQGYTIETYKEVLIDLYDHHVGLYDFFTDSLFEVVDKDVTISEN